MLFLLFMLLENGFHYKVNAFYAFYAFRPSWKRNGLESVGWPGQASQTFPGKGEKHKKH
jgi:hypothetical protein